MLNVSLAARARLANKLARKNASPEFALRFVRRTGGYKLSLDRANPADTTITCEGKNVLLLDESMAQAMKDMTLDVTDKGAGPRLTLN